jgi:RNA polymerase sigma-70 factor, ECF subfamily
MTDITHLLVRARAGDQGAFADVVASAQTDVQRFCAGCVNWTEAPDLAQETFLRAWKSIQTFSGESSGRSWLFGVARNVVADYVRRHARRRGIRRFSSLDVDRYDSGASLASNVASTGGDRCEQIALEQLISELSDEQREAFVLTQLIGLSYEEAAESAQVAVGTIRSRVARARGNLIAAITATEVEDQGPDSIDTSIAN